MIRERFCTAKNRSKCPGVDADGIQTQKKRCDTEECNGTSSIKRVPFVPFSLGNIP